ncbi:hypothetical protein L6452_20432 [Arctium lappa]|uniref:Uncharacterized protein n=1 Tax=Arctium lappa TaxID=4217 RepID=A0ACB9BFR0_ARCLA|nr:hypothetical protein L6452_20432 [Arctium lappa]
MQQAKSKIPINNYHHMSKFTIPFFNLNFKPFSLILQINKTQKFATLISLYIYDFYQPIENPPNWCSYQTHTLYPFQVS